MNKTVEGLKFKILLKINITILSTLPLNMKFNKIYYKPYLLLLVSVFLFNCGTTSKTKTSKVKEDQLKSLLADKNFIITSDMALPMMTNSMNSLSNSGLLPPGSAANQISLIGNSNYLKVVGDSVSANLPYFGERQMGGGYNGNKTGIEFSGIPEKWELKQNEKTQRYDLSFKINNSTESFRVSVTLFPNLTTTININSSQRFPIRYSGSVAPISEE